MLKYGNFSNSNPDKQSSIRIDPAFMHSEIRNIHTYIMATFVSRGALAHGALLMTITAAGIIGGNSSPIWPATAVATLLLSLAVSLARFVGEVAYGLSGRAYEQLERSGSSAGADEAPGNAADDIDDEDDEDEEEPRAGATFESASAVQVTRAFRLAGALGLGPEETDALVASMIADAAAAATAGHSAISGSRVGRELPLPSFLWKKSNSGDVSGRGAAGGSVNDKASPTQLPSCAICFEAFAAGDTCRALVCAHTYHDSCLARWLSFKQFCPECRTEIF
jgi:hypothetical protein